MGRIEQVRAKRKLIDAHIHLDRFDDPAAALARLRSAGIQRTLIPGVCEPYEQPLRLDGVEFGYGQHPLFDPEPDWSHRLDQAITDQRPHALGEVGLDRNAGPDQVEILSKQLELARAHALPLIVHLVGDGGSLLSAIRRHPSSVMLHRCGGRPSRFEPWWSAGYYVSVGPRVGRDLRLLEAVPDHLLLLESDAECEDDAPWDTLPALYEAAARAKNCSSDSIKALVFANYNRFLEGE
jgi:TatD DNase family protein